MPLELGGVNRLAAVVTGYGAVVNTAKVAPGEQWWGSAAAASA